MEFKINEITLPRISFNYDELKHEVAERVKKYEAVVYNDEQIKEAKADRAALNKLKKALNDERIRREREYMAPFNEFKEQVNEIIKIIDNPIGLIDSHIKEFEDARKAEKNAEIEKLFNSIDRIPNWLRLEMIFNPKWVNAAVTVKQIATEMNLWINKVNNDLATLENLPEFSFEAIEVYKSTLDITKAINEGKRLAEIQRKKVEAEKQKAVEVKPDIKEIEAKEPALSNWISFSAKLTVAQAVELRAFFERRNIEFKVN